MNRFVNLLLVFLLLVPVTMTAAQPPAYRLRDRQMEYHGPGREEQAGDSTGVIPIAWFGPDEGTHPEGGDLYSAAQLAIEQANAASGYQGRVFRLLPAWSETPWDEGARRLAGLVYEEGVVAIVGGIDGASTHVAEQIAAKARLPVIAPVATDKSVNLAGVPWIFSCMPGDHLLAPVLADSIAGHAEPRRIVLLSSTDHDAHLFTVELLAALRDRQVGLAQHHDFSPKTADLGDLARQTIKADPNAVILVADTRVSAQLVVELREAGFMGVVYSGLAAARRPFVEIAKREAEGVVVPMPAARGDSEETREFEAQFRERSGYLPDYAASQTYDAVSMLVAAIRKAGPNRVRIADALRELSPYPGVAGVIRWDRVGANSRAVQLGVYRDGRIVVSK